MFISVSSLFSNPLTPNHRLRSSSQLRNQTNYGTIQQEAQPNELKIDATNSTCITTSIAVVMDYRTKTSKNLLICGTANGNHYEVAGVSDEIIQANKHLIMNGEIELSMPKDAYLNSATATLEMPTMSKTNQFFKETRGRRNTGRNDTKSLFDRAALAVAGTRSVLVVRVVASDVAPNLSEATLSNSVFGNGADGTDDPVTMKSHFNTCSHGQLNFVEADDRDGETILIRNGMREKI